MRRLVLRRIGAMAIVLPLTSVVIFLLTSVVPGDVARRILGREATQTAVDAKRHELGLDESLVQQYLHWLGGFLRGDWGTSFTKGEPVRDLVLDALGRSLTLGALAFLLLVPIALVLGITAGLREGSWLDRTISIVGLCGTATPEFVSGIVLLLVFSVRLGWLPASARSEYGLKGLILPVACLLIVTVGYVTRMVRASVVATMHRPFIRTGRLKGLSTPQLVRRHVLRNSLVVPVTTLGVQLRYLVGGLVTVELLFNYAGLGTLLLTAARAKDVPTLQAATLVTGVFVVATFLLADICYTLLDPRVRVGAAT